MDKKYLENDKLIIKIKVSKNVTIYWYKEENDNYRVRVLLYNREIYNRVLDNKHYKIYYEYHGWWNAPIVGAFHHSVLPFWEIFFG